MRQAEDDAIAAGECLLEFSRGDQYSLDAEVGAILAAKFMLYVTKFLSADK